MAYQLSEIVRQFTIDVNVEAYGNGHINDTYIANSEPKYILQRINSAIFKKPEEVMANIVAVTEFLRKKIIAAGGDPERETLNVIKTVDGKSFYKTDDGNYFRMYKYVERAVGYEMVESPEQFYQAARSFGKFQNMLADYPAETLFDTIPRFHDTEKRFADFEEAVANDLAGRKVLVKDEIDFVLSRKADASVVLNGIRNGEIPLRVTHNDTKLNNVLLDSKTGEGVCVIDLDTVMPGSLLYDYGDALRFGASSGAEDEIYLEKIYFDLELFEAFTKGFIEEVGGSLTPAEIELLPFSAKLLTYECGMRFLGDYLNGDTYFKIHREHHNLDRARTQFKLVADIENKLDEMKKIVKKYI
ncbi:MAG: aminoglycoside phosphotransferase family protein [Clostridia bacterium]|nr:aminoglycoside phosphotransferase family protein [Clostridia bacterium]